MLQCRWTPNDVFVEVSGLLKALAVNLMKIANDFRIMNSDRGHCDALKAMRQGSTIMPGKVNPVIPEMTMQCAMRIIANDTAITMAAAHGEFELNAFYHLCKDSLLEALNLRRALSDLRGKCVETIEPDVENCKKHLEQSYAFATAYTPKLGYETVAWQIIKENPPEKAKEILICGAAKQRASEYKCVLLLGEQLKK